MIKNLTMAVYDVGIVGAGLAGLTCARRLQEAGYGVAVLEKSRGLGGRMATRRMNDVPIDHGARFFQPQSSLLSALVHWLMAEDVLTLWHPQIFALDGAGRGQEIPEESPYYVAPMGMATVGKVLGQGLDIWRQHRVTAIAPTPEATWQITTECADNGAVLPLAVKALVLAIPAPQALSLVAPLAGMADLAAALAAVRYAPCITVMAQYDNPPAVPGERFSPHVPWMVEGTSEEPFFWVGLDSSKRPTLETPERRVVIHSSAAFAQQWMDAPSLQPGGEYLLQSASHALAGWLAKPDRWQVHRWRYALVTQPSPQALLQTASPLPLVACGDWCGDGLRPAKGHCQLDSALTSGWAAAEAIAQAIQPIETGERWSSTGQRPSLPSFDQVFQR